MDDCILGFFLPSLQLKPLACTATQTMDFDMTLGLDSLLVVDSTKKCKTSLTRHLLKCMEQHFKMNNFYV